MAKLRLGIVGIGTIFKYQLQSLKKQNDIELIALCDRDKHKVLYESEKLGVLAYHNIDQMLVNDEIDATLVSTPTQTHYAIGLKVVNAGKHLMLEKPATVRMDELSDLYEAARRNRVKIIVLYHAAFAKDLLWFKEIYEKELIHTLGPITEMECNFYDPYIMNGHLCPNALSLVGSWVDSGINCLSVVARLVDPLSITLKIHNLEYFNDMGKINSKATVQYVANVYGISPIQINIKTDWTLGMNKKQTLLKFSETENQVLIDHTEQKVVLLCQDGQRIMADFSLQGERLSAQYDGVFQNAVSLLTHNKDNYVLNYKLHSLLLDEIILHT